MEPCTTYQNTHHQLTVVIGSQWGKTCWPFRFKLMSNIKYIIYRSSIATEKGKKMIHIDYSYSNIYEYTFCMILYSHQFLHTCT